jgi:filamentous hemagglutinin
MIPGGKNIDKMDDAFRSVDNVADAAKHATCVYSCVVDGVTRYVGITDDIVRRGKEHLRTKNIEIEGIKGLENLSRADARAVEQMLIHYYGLGKNGGTLINMITSISSVNNPTAYEQALVRGKELLDNVGYKWTH